jgi:6-phosphogluconolactonase/glucosamine-6-phosphate isomerase/deaminase
LIQRSQEAFRRDLPRLLQTKGLYRHWVAYHGDERVGFARSDAELYEQCFRRGLKDHEFVVRCIVPELPRDLDFTPSSEL